MTAPREVRPVTDRQIQILALAAAGHSNKEIGAKLFLTETTVKVQLSRMYRKIGARDRAHAVALAFRAGALK